jgi:pullulanase/glycogen debranching enzyme
MPNQAYEAQNAVSSARWAGAEQHANGTFSKAKQLLDLAQDYQARKAGMKPTSAPDVEWLGRHHVPRAV